jgi:salicylate hydroxylase
LLFGINSETDMQGMWDERGDIAYVRGIFGGSCEDLRTALDVATSCDRWKLGKSIAPNQSIA